jgi:hypothetical protein
MMTRARLTGCAPSWIVLGFGVLVLGTAACTARSPIAIPADLPNHTDQGGFHFRWTLLQEPTTVRAVGLIESSRIVPWATLALFGVDRDGRVVSRGDSEVQGGFGHTSLPFEIALRPSGREERFDLILIHAQEGKPGE